MVEWGKGVGSERGEGCRGEGGCERMARGVKFGEGTEREIRGGN